jgi:predicted transglutaminase-like cysteine proteinase
VLDEQGDGHAVLLARTESGDLVLDNRRDEIKRWTETRYQFLKRQSEQNPRKWLALTPKSAPDSGAIAGN